jgi:hypothetical protein
MNLGEILDRTFQIYRSRFLVFFGIAAIPSLMMATVGLTWRLLGVLDLQPTVSADLRTPLRELASWLADENLKSYLYCLVSPWITFLASRAFMQEAPPARAAISMCISRWRSWLGLAAIAWVMLYFPLGILNRLALEQQATASAASLILNDTSARMLQVGAILLFLSQWVVRSLMSVALGPSVPAWTLEGLSVPSAIRRGWQITKDCRVRILASWFAIAAIQIILHIVLSSAGAIILRVLSGFTQLKAYFWTYQALVLLPTTGSSILIAPVFPIAITLFYYDQRIRREGYDIERLMESAGMTAPLTPPAGEGIAAPAVPAPAIVEVPPS